jgi:hypothetical protein
MIFVSSLQLWSKEEVLLLGSVLNVPKEIGDGPIKLSLLQQTKQKENKR